MTGSSFALPPSTFHTTPRSVRYSRALETAQEHLPNSYARELQWLSDRLGELWTLRGPCPGLGAALQAFGVDNGILLVRTLAPLIEENADPWEVVDRAMDDPHSVVPGLQAQLGINLRRKWKALNEERRSLLKLLSRFDLSSEQAERWYQPEVRAEAGIACTDSHILANPYILYEQDRYSVAERDRYGGGPISVRTIDHGAFPPPMIADKPPLPAPSAMEDSLDVRRVRA